MSLNFVANPYSYYNNRNKTGPLFNGFIYVGIPDLDPTILANQKQVTAKQEDGTQVPIAQPIRTNSGGYAVDSAGNPVVLLVDGNYSIRVNDKNGNIALEQSDVNEGVPLTTDNGVSTVDKVSDLRDIEPTQDGQQISLLGHTYAGVGGGNWYYDESDTTTIDNNITVVVTSLGARWKRPYFGEVFASWGGLDLTGSTNDTSLMQAVVNLGFPVYMESGDYQFANIVPASSSEDMIIRGDTSTEGKVTVSGPSGYSGYIFNTTTGYSITGVAIRGGGIDGQYGIGSNTPSSGGGRVVLDDIDARNFDQCIYFGEEYEHPIGLKYTNIYCQFYNTAAINLGGTSGAASSGESCFSIDDVMTPNQGGNIVEYANVTQNNVPSATQDTIDWTGDAPEFGYIVLRSADNSTGWHVPPNWTSGNFTSEAFISSKESGETWFYKVLRMTVGMNIRRAKIVNIGVLQNEYTGIGLRLDDIDGVNVGSHYYEIRNTITAQGGFAAIYASSSIASIQESRAEDSGYGVYVASNSKVRVGHANTNDCIYAVFGNSGSTDQALTYDIAQTGGSTPAIYRAPNNGSNDYNYDGIEYYSGNELVRKISHAAKSSHEFQFRGVTKGRMFADSEGCTVEINKLDLELSSKTLAFPISNDIGETPLVDDTATDVLTFDSTISNTTGTLSFNYQIKVLDGSSVVRQVEGGILTVSSAKVSSGAVTSEASPSSQSQALSTGTLISTWATSVSVNTTTVTVAVTTTVANPIIRLELTPIAKIGDLESITQL